MDALSDGVAKDGKNKEIDGGLNKGGLERYL